MLSHQHFLPLMQLAQEQAVVGIVSQGLMDSGVRMGREDALNLYALQQAIRRQNSAMDKAVVALCKQMADAGIRIYVMKGQTLAALYPDVGLRQSGDIDFLCHPADWERAVSYVREELGVTIKDHNSQKHVEWQKDGVQYEMHRMLTDFAYPQHQRYWDEVVMAEVLDSHATVEINGYPVSVLPPTINVLYTFVHIFYHLLIEGIGLRQFCDWAVLLAQQGEASPPTSLSRERGGSGKPQFDVETLERHLEGIGLMKAFTGLGTVLTDYLGLPEEQFPFEISDKEHRSVSKVLNNILVRGNFGHNVHYVRPRGPLHGLQHLWEMGKQSTAFYHYAPAEGLWRIPEMFRWWGKKICRRMKK